MSNLLWYKQNNQWVNPNLLSKKNNFKEAIIYYKSKNKWVLLENKEICDIIWTTEMLSACSTRQDFSDLVEKSFGNDRIEINNILLSSSYNIDMNYGVDIRFSDWYKNKDAFIFCTGFLSLPKYISWTVNQRTNSSKPTNRIFFQLIDENLVKKTIFNYIDAHIDSSNVKNDGAYVDGIKVQNHNYNASNSWTYSVNLPEDCPNCKLESNKKYKIAIYNSYTYNGYATGPMYLTNLEIKF